MKTLGIHRLVGIIIGACAATASGHAVAQGAYAAAYNNIFNLSVTSTDENGANGPFFIPLSDFTDFSVVSASNAELNGQIDLGMPPNSDSAGGPTDSAPAFGLNSVFPGGAPANNDMAPLPPGGEYSRGDAQVSATAIRQEVIGGPVVPTIPLTLTQAWTVADAYIASEGFANASSRNASQTGFTTTITLNQPARINIGFDAMPYARVLIDAGAAGGAANANLETTFTITSGGATIFEWSPDGRPGGIINGEELADELPLNGSIEVTAPGDEAEFYENADTAPFPPLGTIDPVVPAPGDPNDPNDGSGRFAARSNVLPAGTYTLSLDMLDFVNVVTAPAEPIFDYGDNPDSSIGTGEGNYQTTDADGGPVHQIGGPYLGQCVDADDGTLQDEASLADDLDSALGLSLGDCADDDDEDGIGLPGSVLAGNDYEITVRMPDIGASTDCFVDGWIDFNRNGDYNDAGEQVVQQLFAAGSGDTQVPFTVPVETPVGPLYARFRCSEAGGLGPTGPVDNGEVEDYRLRVTVENDKKIPVMGPWGLGLVALMLTLVAGFGHRRLH